MIVRAILIAIFAVGLWTLSGCATRFSDPAVPRPYAGVPASPVAATVPTAPAPGPATVPGAPKRRVLPDLRSEPLVRVFLDQGPALTFTLLLPARLPDGRQLASGPHRAQVAGATLTIDGAAVPAECPLAMDAAGKRFSAELDPPVGRTQHLEFAGLPVLRIASGSSQAQLLEEVPLETYLAGVVPVEMSPGWPVQALAAQAIAARSYAAAKYLERFDRPWQLHWHYTVDMAYAGASARSTAGVRAALADTRGQLLTYRGLPVPALFHACSGGSTEAAANLWPGLLGGDRATPMTTQMPVVADPEAEAGCAALGLLKSHWRWKADIPLSQVTRGLQGWARVHPEAKLAFGTVTSVEALGTNPGSGRTAQVVVSHKLDGRTKRTPMAAQDFRMAIDPGVCRSTWWDRCLVVAGKTPATTGGVLVLAGRGFGHGVGLSQVSAWQLASKGGDAASIVHRFYPLATLERRW